MKKTHDSIRKWMTQLEAAIERRDSGDKSVVQSDVTCEVCGDLIHYYIGPGQGIICSACYELRSEIIGCGNPYPDESPEPEAKADDIAKIYEDGDA